MLLSKVKEKQELHIITCVNLKNILLNKRGQIHRSIYGIIPFYIKWNTGKELLFRAPCLGDKTIKKIVNTEVKVIIIFEKKRSSD